MADKIKSFFQKKKANVKFMNAGKGYKLTDSSTSQRSNSDTEKEPIKRAEPTQEAKTAGQAALARLEAKKTDPTKFNTSYAAIQARVKRELEQERAKQEAQTQESMVDKKEDAKEIIEENPLLSVTGAYFRCPYLSDEILSRDEWKIKIKEFLYEQLKGEEAGLTACLIIQNCNASREKVTACVETLGKYLDNIVNNPEVEKYRKIRMSNRIFQEKVSPMEGALEFLKAAGFQQNILLNNDMEEEFLVWNPDQCNMEDLTMLAEGLKSAELIPLELDRNLQVLLPHQANERSELPTSFFTISPEELKREQQLRSEAVEKNQILRTKAMREKEEQRELRKYKYALIRIKFPDNLILQGTFSVYEKFQAVVDFVRENLVTTEIPFSLKVLAGQTYTEDYFDKTLLELRLIPAALLMFSWNNDKTDTTYLKEEVLSYVDTM